jgi:hypothetical protein
MSREAGRRDSRRWPILATVLLIVVVMVAADRFVTPNLVAWNGGSATPGMVSGGCWPLLWVEYRCWDGPAADDTAPVLAVRAGDRITVVVARALPLAAEVRVVVRHSLVADALTEVAVPNAIAASLAVPEDPGDYVLTATARWPGVGSVTSLWRLQSLARR